MNNIRQRLANAFRHHVAGRVNEIESVYREILAADPECAEAWHLLGVVEIQRNNPTAAEPLLRKAVALDSGQPAHHNSLASALILLGRPEEAEGSLRRVLTLDPNFVDAQFDLGNVLMDLGRFSEAVGAFQRVLAIDADNADAHNNLGNALKQAGRLEEAVHAYRCALNLRPDHIAAGNNLGIVLRELGRMDEALDIYRRILAIRPELAETHHNLGIALWETGKREEALAAYRRALTIKPDFVAAHHNLGAALKEMGRLDQAVEAYRKLLEFDPSNANARHILAALMGETTKSAPREYVQRLFDSYASHFDQDLVENLSYAIPRLLREAVDDVLGEEGGKREMPFRRALDLGCGTGLAAQQFRDAVEQFHGVDLSPKMLAQAKQKGVYDALFLGDGVEFLGQADSDDGYDLILAADVFIYIGKLESTFAAVARRLTGGGLFVFSVERLDRGSYALRPSGRYAQSEDYIRRLATAYGFVADVCKPVRVRVEKNMPIEGLVFVLRASCLR